LHQQQQHHHHHGDKSRVHAYERGKLEHHNHWTEEEWKTLTSYEGKPYAHILSLHRVLRNCLS